MAWFCEPLLIMVCVFVAEGVAGAQKAPPTSARPWDLPSGQQLNAPARPAPVYTPDPSKTYTLPELVNIA
jgi:hypothetical protein